MAYSACSLGPPGSGRQNQSSSSPLFLTRFLSGRHISAVFASFSGFSPPFGSLVAYPVGAIAPRAFLWLLLAPSGFASPTGPRRQSQDLAVGVHRGGRWRVTRQLFVWPF